MQLPEKLPPELVPPSRRDLDDSVDRVKHLLQQESRTQSPGSIDSPISYMKNRSFNAPSPSFDSNRDATIYKYTDLEPTGVYKPRSRHVDRDAIRSRNDEDSPSADLQDMKRRLANTAQMLDRAAEAGAQRTREDEELTREMEDLKYRVKRVQEDLDYNSRGAPSASRENERRRLERELLSLMHERIPEVERKIRDRDERKERERRQWARDRDRANEKFGRYDSRDDYSHRDDRDRPYSRGEDRDRLYADRDRPRSRGDSRPYSRQSDHDRPYSRDSYDHNDRDRSDREYDRPRSPPLTRAAPSPPPVSVIAKRGTPPAPQVSPSTSQSSMTPEKRKAYLQEQAKLRVQQRMLALGVVTPSTQSPTLDTSVEDRLQQDKKEAEEKTKAAEKQAEERERARRERLEQEKALKEGKSTPAAPAAPTPTTATSPVAPASKPIAPTKTAPPPPKPRARAPPPPRKATAPAPAPTPVPILAPPTPRARAPRAPAPEPLVDPEEERLRAREEALRKSREERETARQERERKLKELEEQEAATARSEEEQYQRQLEAMKVRQTKSSSPPVPTVQSTPPPPAAPPAPSAKDYGPTSAPALSSSEKSTNPFSRLLKESGASAPTSPSAKNGPSTNPWARPQAVPPAPSPSRSPAPSSAKTSYQTAPSSAIDDDWDDIKENEGDEDSSDDEIAVSRTARANIAQALFGNMVPRPPSAPSVASPTVSSNDAPPPPPAPSAPIVTSGAPNDRGSLLSAIQGGKALRSTKTVDKSGPPVSGRVLGDAAPPTHINTVTRASSPPASSIASSYPAAHNNIPETPPMVNANASKSDNRQSVGWFADRAADLGGSPVIVDKLPSTLEVDEEEFKPTPIPEILVDEPAEPTSDLMADINKSVGMYAFWI